MTTTATEPTFLEFQGLKVSNEERREVSGLALPYGEQLDRPTWTGARFQTFDSGAAVVRENAALFYGHDHLSDGLPIGRITSHEQTDTGLTITARISDTPKGNEVYTLLKDGVLDRFSVGFYQVANHLQDVDTDAPVLHHTEIDVFEVSIVPDPAFKSAKVDTVLSNQTPSPEGTTVTTTAPETFASADDVQTLSDTVTAVQRQMATLAHVAPSDERRAAPAASYGEFIKLAAARDPEAVDFLEYVGGVVGDLGDHVKDAWVGDLYRLVTAPRKVINLFGRQALPPNGMSIEYGKVDAAEDTLKVEKQAAEGDTLAYGKIRFDTGSAPVQTYGGWGEMSRQQIERTPFNVIERYFRALLQKYAATTEAAAKAVALANGSSTALVGSTLTLDNPDAWIDFLIDSALYLENRGILPEFIAVSGDVFKGLAKVRDGANGDAARLLGRDSGRVSIKGISGELYELPVIPIATTATNVVRVGNESAITTYEASGAPFRLQDDDITNLTHALSIYGYAAFAPEDPKAMLRPATVQVTAPSAG